MTRFVKSNWETALLVCRKCSKRQKGFGPKGRTGLAKALRRELHLRKGRKARIGIVEVKCLGICPRHAVTMVDTRAPGQWLLVRPGTAIAEVVDTLEL